MTEELHITSLVVRAEPCLLASVHVLVLTLDGAEIHGADEATGRLVVTLEGPTQRTVLDQLALIQQAPGVLSAAMVYQHAEPLASLNTELTHVDPS
ncbi:MAG: hypothetical protein RI907_2531 [Pseudomonadota bacterium]